MIKALEVHNLEEFQQLIITNKDKKILFTNAESSIFYMGIGYIHQMITIIREQFPQYQIDFLLNCENDARLVIEAINLGFNKIKFTGNKIIFAKLLTITSKQNIDLVYEDN